MIEADPKCVIFIVRTDGPNKRGPYRAPQLK
jgi:hypothetical protein